jgi:hypothetical protein
VCRRLLLWIPRGTVHRFTVTSRTCRALNGYAPAGFEQVIIGLAKPAERRELPPPMDPPDQVTVDKFSIIIGAQRHATTGHCPGWEYDERSAGRPRFVARQLFRPGPLPTTKLANGCQQTIAAPMRRYYHIPPAPDLCEDL